MKAKAFTLIELLVVISIISLIMGILLPCFGKIRELEKSLRCKTNLRNIYFAINMYADDYDGVGPYLGERLESEAESGYLRTTPELLLDPYLKSWAVWQCPSDEELKREHWFTYGQILVPPKDYPDQHKNISYTWVEIFLRGPHEDQQARLIDDKGRSTIKKMPRPWWKKKRLADYDGCLLFDGSKMLDMWSINTSLSENMYTSLDQSHGKEKVMIYDVIFDIVTKVEYHKINFLFSDGSVETKISDPVTLQELDEQIWKSYLR